MICKFRVSRAKALLLALAVSLQAGASLGVAQTSKNRDDDSPIFQEYRSVRIGMTTEEVRKRLSNLSDKSDEQDFFVFSESENAQVYYDKAHKVFAISVNFLNGAQNIPTPKGVFGSDLAAKPDGSMYKMVRYPKAGYWVSFCRTAGAEPLTTVTLQKIE